MVAMDGAVYTRREPRTTWAELDAEVPALSGWVTEHGATVEDIAQRLVRGARRRVEAMERGDDRLLRLIDERLLELRAEVRTLDYGARRLAAIRALYVVRYSVGECEVSVRSIDGEVAIDVRPG